jgi:putative transposase
MRSLRILRERATYHVTSEINRGEMGLYAAQFKILFLSFVKKAKTRFRFRLWDFCIMDNHIHFLIEPGPGISLSEIMQWLKCNFAKAWNKAHGVKGHLWGERFYSRIIRKDDDFSRVREYIAENPVKAGLVERAVDWVFGSLYHRLHGQTELLEPA